MHYMPILNQSQPPLPNSRPREHSFHPPVKHQVPVPWVETSKAMKWPTRSSQYSNHYTPWKSRWCNCHISYMGCLHTVYKHNFCGEPSTIYFHLVESWVFPCHESWPDQSVEPSSNSSTPPFQTSRNACLKKWLLQKIQQFSTESISRPKDWGVFLLQHINPDDSTSDQKHQVLQQSWKFIDLDVWENTWWKSF